MENFDREDIFSYLLGYLIRLGYAIIGEKCSTSSKLPDIQGYKPDMLGDLKGKRTIYGVTLMPDDLHKNETFERLRALSANPKVPVYVAFPEKEKQWFILMLINHKLFERRNICKVFMP